MRPSIEIFSTIVNQDVPRKSLDFVNLYLYENKMHFVFRGEKMNPALKQHSKSSFRNFWSIPVIKKICVLERI